jgi:hypothetical protein
LPRRSRAAAGFLALAAAAVGAAPAGAQPSSAGEGTFLKFMRDGDGFQRPPNLGLSFGGSVRRANMDTGSTGVVVAASAIPGVDQLPTRGPGELTYTSSGRIMQGDWVVTPVTITGANGVSVTTQPIAVLAVRRIACTERARNCTPRENPSRVAMIGVGFARKRDRDINPFLNIAAKVSRRGYAISRDGVQVGLPSAGAGSDYVTVQLRWDDEVNDWAPAPACITINDRAPAACGTVLPDTGLTSMFLRLPPSQEEGISLPSGTDRTLPPGTKVSIALAPDGDRASYSFRVGDASDPLAPSRVILVKPDARGAFVNTGVRLYNGFDYFFDADKGVVGYRPRAANAAR